MTRFLSAILMCCAIGLGVLDTAAIGQDTPHPVPSPRGTSARARIQHLDGSGRATIVDIDPGVPGRDDFLHATSQPIPQRGELILPTATIRPSPSPTAPTRR